MVQDFASFIRSRLGAEELPQQQPAQPMPAPMPVPQPAPMSQPQPQQRMSPQAVVAALAALQQQPNPIAQQAAMPPQAAPSPMAPGVAPQAAALGGASRVLSPAEFAAVNNLRQVQAPPSETENPDAPYEGTWVTVSYNYQGTQYYLLVPEERAAFLPDGASVIENGTITDDPDRVKNAEVAGQRGVVGNSFSGLLSQAPPEIQGAFRGPEETQEQGRITDRVAQPDQGPTPIPVAGQPEVPAERVAAPPPGPPETTQAPVNDEGQTHADIRDQMASSIAGTTTRLAGTLPGREGYTNAEGQATPDLNLWEIEKVDPVKAGILREAGIGSVPVDQMVIRDAEGNVRLVPQAETAPAGAEIIIYGGKSEKPEPPSVNDGKLYGVIPLPDGPIGDTIETVAEAPFGFIGGANEVLGDPLGLPQREYHSGMVEYADIIAQLPGPIQQFTLAGIRNTPMLNAGSAGFIEWQVENREIVEQVKRDGFTAPNGQHFEGNQAVWERYQQERNLIERTADTVGTDPLNVLPSMGAPARAGATRVLGSADEAVSAGRRVIGQGLNVVADILDIPERGLETAANAAVAGAGKAFRQLEKTPLFQQTTETVQRNAAEEAETQLDDVIAQRDTARLEEPEAGRYEFDDGSVAVRGDDGSYTLVDAEGDVLLEDATWDAVQIRNQTDNAARAGATSETTATTTPEATAARTASTGEGRFVRDPETGQPVRVEAERPQMSTAASRQLSLGEDAPAGGTQADLAVDRPIDDLGAAPGQQVDAAQQELPTDRPVDDLGEAPPIRPDAEFVASREGQETEADLATWPEFMRPQTAADRAAGKNRVGVDFSARPVDMARAMASELPDRWRAFRKEYGRRLTREGGYAQREAERVRDRSWKPMERSNGTVISDFDLKKTHEILMEADHMVREQARVFTKHFGNDAELPDWSWKRWADPGGGSVHTAMETFERTAREGGEVPLNEQVEIAIFHPDDQVAESALEDVIYRIGVHNEDGTLKVTRSGQPVYSGKLDPRLRGTKGQPGIFTQIKNLRRDHLENMAESGRRKAANPDMMLVDDVNQLSRIANQEVAGATDTGATAGAPAGTMAAREVPGDVAPDPATADTAAVQPAAGREPVEAGQDIFERDYARSLDEEAAAIDPEGAAVAERAEVAGAFEDAAQPGPAALPYRATSQIEATPMGPPGWSARPQPMQGPEAPMQGPRALSPDEARRVRAGEATPEAYRSGIEQVRQYRQRARTETPTPTRGERRQAERVARQSPARQRRSMATRQTLMRPDELQSFYVRGRVPSAKQMETLGQEFANGESLIERWDRYTSENLAKMDTAGLSIDDAERRAREQVLNDWAVENLTPEQKIRYDKEFAKAKKLKNAQGTTYTDLEAQIEALERIHERAGRTKWGYKYDTFMSALREVFLYNVLTGPRYIQTQALGNTITAILTKHYGVVGDTISPRAVKKAVEKAIRSGEAPPSLMREVADQYGLGGQRRLVTGGNAVRDQTSGTIDDAMRISKLPGIGKYTGPLASRTIRDVSAMFDMMPREALWAHLMDADLSVARRTLRERIVATAPEGMADEIAERFDALPQRFSSSDLREALGDVDRKWADRHARDWQEALSKTDKAARDEVKRVFFDGGERNIDRHLKRVFFFHYWMSRATPLYTEAIIRDPVYFYNYLNLLQEMEDDDDLSGTDFVKWFKTPMGYNTLIRPDAFFQAFGSFYEDAGFAPDGESWLGKALRKSPIMVNPIMQMIVNMAGLSGDTFAPDPLGLNKFIQLGQASIDYANARFGWGLPPVGNISDKGMVWLREQVSGTLDFLPGINEVPYSDPMAYKDNEVRAIVAEIGLERGLPVDDPVVLASMQDPSSEMYQEAMKRYSQQDLLDITLRILPGTAVLYPKAQLASPKERTRDIRAGKDPVTGGYSDEALGLMQDRDLIASPTDYAQALQIQEQEYKTLGTEQERGAFRFHSSIRFGSTREPIVVGGQQYTPAQLQAMEDADRKALADQWAEETGNTERVAAVRDQRKAYRDEHPEYAEYSQWQAQLGDYPGGVVQWWQDTAAGNPNAARWYNALDEDEKTNEITLTSTDAWMAFQGEKRAYWEPDPIATRTDVPPGPYNPIGDGDGADGSSSGSSETKQYGPSKESILKQIEEYNADMQEYNALASQMLGGDQEVNVDLINPMARSAVVSNLESIGVTKPRMGGYLYDYLQWAETQQGDTSIDAYLTWYAQQNPRKEADAEAAD